MLSCTALGHIGLANVRERKSEDGGAVDGDAFDSVVRDAVSAGSRRQVVRTGLGGLGLASLGLLTAGSEGAEAKKKRRKKKKKKQRCTSDRPVACGNGCCPSQYPQCCESASNPNPDTRNSCNPPTFTCCTAADGGGSCPTDTKCCPPTAMVGNEFGSCAPKTGTVCCPANTLFDWCPSDLPTCCDADCCAADETCCDAGGNCPDGFECLGSCCIAVARVSQRQAATRKGRGTGGGRFVMSAR